MTKQYSATKNTQKHITNELSGDENKNLKRVFFSSVMHILSNYFVPDLFVSVTVVVMLHIVVGFFFIYQHVGR